MDASVAQVVDGVASLSTSEAPAAASPAPNRAFQGVARLVTARELSLVHQELGYVPVNLVKVAATVSIDAKKEPKTESEGDKKASEHASDGDTKKPKTESEGDKKEPKNDSDDDEDTNDEGGERPAVLLLYPLRGRAWAHKKRQRAAVEPFPTVYWLASRELKARISELEDRQFVNVLERRLVESPVFMKRMQESHESYARERWEMLTPSDRELVERNGWTRALRDVGVAGIRNFAAVKCLHTHYAHFLATGENLIGEWVHELLTAEADTGKTCSSTSSDVGE